MEDYIEITQELAWAIQSEFPYCGRNARANSPNYNRYIQIRTSFDVDFDPSGEVHFELTQGHIELHFEGRFCTAYSELLSYLKDKTKKESDSGRIEWFCWMTQDYQDACRLTSICKTKEDVFNDFRTMQALFNPRITAFLHPYECLDIDDFPLPEADCQFEMTSDDVNLYEIDLLNMLNLPLAIPDYQRVYCWEEQNVIRLLDDIFIH